MSKPTLNRSRRADTSEPVPGKPFVQRWYGKLAMLLIAVVLLSLAYAPFQQFYLAWIGLVPWLIVLRNCRTQWRAIGWSWVFGTLFFSANMWWIASVTGPGSVALMAWMGVYWTVAGAVIRGLGLVGSIESTAGSISAGASGKQRPSSLTPSLDDTLIASPVFSVVAIAMIWTGIEWFRGSWPFGGLAWSYIGHSQTPVLHLCQVADFAGELGVSFWVALLNGTAAMVWIHRRNVRRVLATVTATGVVLAGVLGYGIFRFSQEEKSISPGPTVMVVQPNIPQDNSGEKGKSIEEIVAFHFRAATQRGLKGTRGIDLVAWSETMMPPFNSGYRNILRGSDDGASIEDLIGAISRLAKRESVAILAGGSYLDDFRKVAGRIRPGDSRNSVYYYERTGVFSDLRYDKIHLVPFGEFIPFKESIPLLYRMLISLGPPNMDAYQLTRGDASQLTVFPLTDNQGRKLRFVTPICFEDTDASLVARMFRPDSGTNGGKRADFIVNVTNDGWFKYVQMPQHFQAAQFRSIENRAPTARSVNTGISGFIDSMGRAGPIIPAGTEGTSVHSLRLDARITPFSRYGNVFAMACTAGTALMAGGGAVRWIIRRRGRKSESA